MSERTLETAVVKSWEVEARSGLGWRVAQVIESSEVEVANTSREHANPDGYGSTTLCDTTAVVVQTPLFLMTRDEAHEKMGERILAQRGEIEELGKSVAEGAERIAEVEQALSAANGRASRISDMLDGERDKHREVRGLLRKFETDMGLIRGAIGTKQMDEILGGGG